jgi:F-box protein 18 (helicase)
MIVLTDEQKEVSTYVTNVNTMVLVDAKAGTGKSFMARRLVKLLDPKRVLYTAFNKAIVEEATGLFPPSVECKTLHALAYRYTNPGAQIKPLDYKDFPKHLSYKAKYEIKEALETFFVSPSTDMWEFFEHYFEEKSYVEVAVGYIEQMLDKTLPWSFGFMLKYFHLMLAEDPSICQYDLVILDEINDTTAVALEIFKLIEAPKKVGLGDPYQAIYAFLNLVNGFTELEGVKILPLTNSFRCSKKIASDIEKFIKRDLCEDFTFVGTDTPVDNGLELYCTLTNAEIIREVSDRLEYNKPFKLLRKPADIFACSLAVLSASSGKKIYQSQYRFLEDVYEDWIRHKKVDQKSTFFGYMLDELHDPEVHSAINLLRALKKNNQNLFDIYKRVKDHKQTDEYTISTVYTSKGLEFEKVTLSNEFDAAVSKIKENGGVQTEEDITLYRCYYVAASRAGKILNNAHSL